MEFRSSEGADDGMLQWFEGRPQSDTSVSAVVKR